MRIKKKYKQRLRVLKLPKNSFHSPKLLTNVKKNWQIYETQLNWLFREISKKIGQRKTHCDEVLKKTVNPPLHFRSFKPGNVCFWRNNEGLSSSPWRLITWRQYDAQWLRTCPRPVLLHNPDFLLPLYRFPLRLTQVRTITPRWCNMEKLINYFPGSWLRTRYPRNVLH